MVAAIGIRDPKLVLIKTSVNIGSMIFGQVMEMALLNPRGWYCFRTGIDIYNHTGCSTAL